MAAKNNPKLSFFWLSVAISLVGSCCALPIDTRNNFIEKMPSRVKRQGFLVPPGGLNTAVEAFLRNIITNQLDLIVLIERSWFVGRHWFYLEARKFVSHVLRYYTTIGPNNARVAIVSFAGDVTVHVDGIQDPDISKCDILGKYWESVVLDDTENVWRRADIRHALERSRDLFASSSFVNPYVEKYIWLLTSGEFDIIQKLEGLVDQLQSLGIITVATKIGHTTGNKENICKVMKSCDNYGGDIGDWSKALEQIYTELSRSPALLFYNTTCDCDQTFGFLVCDKCTDSNCGSHSLCASDCRCHNAKLCPRHNTQNICPFQSGETGRYCDQKEVECLPGACTAGLECVEKKGHYECKCECSPGLYTICHPDGLPEFKPCPILAPALGGSVGGFVLILAIVISICLWKKKKAPTREMGTNTQSTGAGAGISIRGWFAALYQRSPQNPQTKSTDAASHKVSTGTDSIKIGAYISMEAPSLPNNLPEPTLRRIHSVKQESRTSKSTTLKALPPHQHSVAGVDEITKTPCTIEKYEMPTGAALYEDPYEKSESKDMPGWEAYVKELAEKGKFSNFAIVRQDLQAYATTSSIDLLPNKDELQNIYKIMNSKNTKAQIKLKRSRYSVSRLDNKGTMMESWLKGKTTKVLCVGRSKKFLVMAVQTDKKRTGACYENVKWICNHLSKQKK